MEKFNEVCVQERIQTAKGDCDQYFNQRWSYYQDSEVEILSFHFLWLLIRKEPTNVVMLILELFSWRNPHPKI